MIVLLTGSTGFLGGHLVEELCNKADEVYLLVRSKHKKRLEKKYNDMSNIHIVIGDISSPDLIDDAKLAEKLKERVDTIIHAAAFYDLEGSYSKSFLYNVVGTQNVLYFSRQCKKLDLFHYVSTIAVAGDYQGTFMEEGLDCGQKFENHYAQTKYDAEFLVRTWDLGGAKKRIYRLGVLIGDSVHGEISKIDGPYYFFKILSQWKRRFNAITKSYFIPLPCDPNAIFPIIPVDHGASFILSSVFNTQHKDEMRTYHVISSECPTIKELARDSFNHFGFKGRLVAIPKNRFNGHLVGKIGLPLPVLSYMYGPGKFDRRNINEDFPEEGKSSYSQYKKIFFESAVKKLGDG